MLNVPLPPRPDLDQYRRRAKELVKVAEDKNPAALQRWTEAWFQAVARLLDGTIEPVFRSEFQLVRDHFVASVREEQSRGGRFALASAQFAIANIHGFKDWKDFTGAVRQLTKLNSDEHLFESAVDATITGDLALLRRLLSAHPELLRARSHREHRCTLLHYVAANGVEDYRQKTPANAVAIARQLLDAGAEVDALADTYGGGRGQTTMNLLVSSAHPEIAGLQGPLAELLLDYGAAIEGLDDDGSPLQTALAFGYIATAEALVRRGARIGNITAAAALGRLDLVERFVGGELPEPKESLFALYWTGVPRDRTRRQHVAMHWAATFGRTEVVKYLLAVGLDPASTDSNRMNLLHNATSAPHVELVRYLLSLNAIPLEGRNAWDGTVLSSMLYFATEAKHRRPERIPAFVECLELLIAAGANLDAIDYIVGIPVIDSVLDRHRPRPQ